MEPSPTSSSSPPSAAAAAAAAAYDAVVVGCGVIGTAAARELALGVGARVLVCERGEAPLGGASGGNSALLHSAFDALPHRQESKLMRLANPRWWALAGLGEDGVPPRDGARAEPPFPLEACGAVVVAWTDEEAELLPLALDRAHANGAHRARLLDAEGVYRALPGLGPGARAGLWAGGEAVADGWLAASFLLHQALDAGVELRLATRASAFEWVPARRAWRVSLERGGGGGAETVWARSVINAAGVHADTVEAARRPAPRGIPRFTSRPRAGQFLVLRPPPGAVVPPAIVCPLPGRRTKGMLLWRNSHGHVVVGPTADEQESRDPPPCRDDTARALRAHAERVVPSLRGAEEVTSYTGVRPATEHADYVLHADEEVPWICAAGIRSTGFTSSLGVARRILKLWQAQGVASPAASATPRPEDDPAWTRPPPGWTPRPEVGRDGRAALCGRRFAVTHPQSRAGLGAAAPRSAL